MRVLVTGGNGFLGSHLTRVLHERGYDITLLVRPTSNLNLIQGLNFKTVEGDITNLQSMLDVVPDDIDVLFHNAARMSSWGHRNRFWPQNVEGTLNVLELARRKNIPNFIYTSSGVVYGFPKTPVSEDVPLDPGNTYAESKSFAENHVLDYHNEYGLNVSILRPPLLLGRGDSHACPLLKKMARANQFFMFGRCENPISIVHAEDAARGLVELAENIETTNGEIYNIRSFNKPWWDFCKEFIDELGLSSKMRKMPYSMAYGVAAIGSQLFKAFNKKSAPLDNFTPWTVKLFGRGFVVDDSKIHDHIGFEPKWDCTSTIRDMVSCNLEFNPK